MVVPNPLLEEYHYLTKLIKEELDRAQKFLNFCITIVMGLFGGLLIVLRDESLTNSQVSYILLLHLIPTTILIFQLLYLRPILNYGRIIDYLVNKIESNSNKLNYFTYAKKQPSSVLKYGSIVIAGGISFLSFFLLLILIFSGSSLKLIIDLIEFFGITNINNLQISITFGIYVAFLILLLFFLGRGLIELISRTLVSKKPVNSKEESWLNKF